MANQIGQARTKKAKKKTDYARTSLDYNHQDWPAVFYGPDGQRQVFNGPLEVPEGWHDSPDKFGKDGKALRGAETEIPGLEEALAAGGSAGDAEEDDEDDGHEGDESIGLPAYDDVTAAQIKTMLDKEGVAYETDANKPRLFAQLREALMEQED